MRIRRKRPAASVPGYQPFREVLRFVEVAKADLTAVMPTTRLPGRPLDDALAEFESSLAAALVRLPSWRTPQVEDQWLAVRAGIEASLARSRAVRVRPPELGTFERLVWLVGELLAPLEAFEQAAGRFNELRAARSD